MTRSWINNESIDRLKTLSIVSTCMLINFCTSSCMLQYVARLLWIHYWNQTLCQKYTRQMVCRVPHSATGTRQKSYRQRDLCWVFFVRHSAKPLPRANLALRKEKSPWRRAPRWWRLCRVQGSWHSAKPLPLPRAVDLGTWQRWWLCWVPGPWHSAKHVLRWSLCRVLWPLHSAKAPFCRVQH